MANKLLEKAFELEAKAFNENYDLGCTWRTLIVAREGKELKIYNRNQEEVAVSDFKKAVYGTTQKNFGLQVLMVINQLDDGEVAVILLEGTNTCNTYAFFTNEQEIEDYYNDFIFEGV